jgi:hypothetical protein
MKSWSKGAELREGGATVRGGGSEDDTTLRDPRAATLADATAVGGAPPP